VKIALFGSGWIMDYHARGVLEHPAGELVAAANWRPESLAALAQRHGIAHTTTDWRELGHGPVSPGYSSEEIWFYAARGLTAGDSSPDADELLDVELFDAAQLARLARLGEVDLKTLAGLALAGVALDATDG